jgi:hypothetical protein
MKHAKDGESNKLWYDSAVRGDGVSGLQTSGVLKGQRWNANRQNHQNNGYKRYGNFTNVSFSKFNDHRGLNLFAFVTSRFITITMLKFGKSHLYYFYNNQLAKVNACNIISRNTDHEMEQIVCRI